MQRTTCPHFRFQVTLNLSNFGKLNQIRDQEIKGFDYYVKLSGMHIPFIGWKLFSTDIEANEGIEVTVADLNFELLYDMYYEITFPPLSGNISSRAIINQTDLIFLFEFTQVNGKPHIAIDSSSIQIGYLGIHNTPSSIHSLLQFKQLLSLIPTHSSFV